MSASGCEVLVAGGKVVLRNVASANKKVNADTVLASWASGTLRSGVEDGFEYKLTLKTDVVDHTSMKRMKLDKFLKECRGAVAEIFGYEPFPAGSAPKVLVKKGSKQMKWDYQGENAAVVSRFVEAARRSSVAVPIWLVRHVAAKQRVEPHGLAVILLKAQQVPGGGELVLS